MTMIPMLLSRLPRRAAAVPANGPGRYDPGAGHRPVAAIVAVGLPTALVVAVALSPFELPPILKPGGTTVVNLPWQEPPPPPPQPIIEPKLPPISRVDAPPLVVPPISSDRLLLPEVIDPPILVSGPIIGTTTEPVIEVKPAPLPFVEAKPDPRFASSFQPDYPPYEQRMEIEGIARVRVLVGADGRVKAIEELNSTSPGFFIETRRRALAKWRFKPATRGGTAEESWTSMTVRFRLEK